MIVVVRTADGFEAGHWGYTVDESDDQVGLVVSLTRIVGWTESGLPAGIHDHEARATWYAMRTSTEPIGPRSSERRRGE